MKVTIDSTEPLEQALRVVGAMYDVVLVTSTANSADGHAPASSADGASRGAVRKSKIPRKNAAASKRKHARGGRKPSSRGPGEPASAADLRAWARRNGYAVSDRGRVSGEIVAAYRDAHRR